MMNKKSLLNYAVLVAVVLVLVWIIFNRKLTDSVDKKLEGLVKSLKALPKGERAEQDEQSLPDDHPDMVFLRKFGRLKNLPTEDDMKTMPDKEVNYIVHSYLDNTEMRCQRNIRLGKSGDGGYETCDDYRYRPIKPCVVYSFGIRNDFSFDDDIAKLYGCKVYSFDPSMNANTHRRSDNAWYYKIGIGGSKQQIPDKTGTRAQWDIKTLSEIKTMLHHDNVTLDVLKIDVEASEWPALEDAIATGEINRVRQLLIEVHFYQREFRKGLTIFQKMEAAGFRRFRTHLHPGTGRYRNSDVFPVERRCCYELGFVNENLARDSA
ncbi:putative methyltransferase-like protein 24 [Babylonia areolata]|uniref:putative methyltransferase-like protein 24 n=1 Tax=Babylonia areolata TaxID=304850 RepID=UPI003FD52F2E